MENKRKHYVIFGIRAVALAFWMFSLIITFTSIMVLFDASFVQEGHPLGNFLVRNQYRWDFEFMFAGIYFVWGIFVWRAALHPLKHLSLLDFTLWANLTHGIIMVVLALLREREFWHLITDSILFLSVALILAFIRPIIIKPSP